jgi:hypothetical protein
MKLTHASVARVLKRNLCRLLSIPKILIPGHVSTSQSPEDIQTVLIGEDSGSNPSWIADLRRSLVQFR